MGVAAKGMYECSTRRQGATRRMACSKLALQQKKRGGGGPESGFYNSPERAWIPPQRAEGGVKGRQIRRPFDSDVHLL